MGVNNCVACVEAFVDCANEVLSTAPTVEDALQGVIDCANEMLACIFGPGTAQSQALSQIKK